MKKTKKLLQAVKTACGVMIEKGEDGFACQIPRQADILQYNLCIIVSWGEGWDHVSIHCLQEDKQQFTPFWEDMCYIKNLFFKPSETVMQYHPPSDVYVNNHKHVLHLWRPQETEIILPPINMV